MLINHGLLNRVHFALGGFQKLNSENRFPFQHADKLDAGVDGAVCDVAARKLANDHGASAAITFGAAFFRTRERLRLAQIVQQRHGGRYPTHGMRLSVQPKGDRITHLRL